MWGFMKCFPIILWHDNWHPHDALHPKYGHQIFYDAGNTLFEKSLVSIKGIGSELLQNLRMWSGFMRAVFM